VLGSFGWNTGVAIFLRWLFSFCILLVPATMLGGLYPLVARLAIADVRVTGSRLGLLYFLNTFGSVLGALATGFLLLERLGVTETAVLAAVLSAGLWLVMQRSQRKEGFKGSRSQGIKGPALESWNPRILESCPRNCRPDFCHLPSSA
jgi:predicted membrane-bound spermidine synthase